MKNKSIGIMQPYFLPYLGYFALIKHTDSWVVFDTVQYIDKGWMNRNRILSQSKEGIVYITVPVKKKSRDMLIKDTCIDDTQKWRQKIKGQITFYKKKAPYYYKVNNLINEILSFDTNKLSELNVYALEKICNYLDIDFKYTVFSHDTMGIDEVSSPDEWALEITKSMGANTYINPPGGKSFFDNEKYKKEKIDLKFLTLNLKEYNTFSDTFIPGLSIIDVMMFNHPEEITELLNDYTYE